MNAGATSLGESAHLIRVPEQAATLSRLYSRGELRRCVEDTPWLFRWRYLAEPPTGIELELRIGGARAVVGLEGLQAFGRAADVTRADLPSGLRAACLNGLGIALWRELEALTRRTVEVLDVRLDPAPEVASEYLGFEISAEPRGPLVRGMLRFTDRDPARSCELYDVLAETSQRELPGAPLPTGLPLRWAAVIGSTRLAAAEVQTLEEHDVVLIDDATREPNALVCWLGVGPTRRYAGRVSWRSEGQVPPVLQMVDFGIGGGKSMGADIDAVAAGFDDIPVSLRFELAQWSASLAEVGNLSVGAVIDTGQRIDGHTVSVWVEQRCIGKGQLVAVGERLGVRLVSVFAGGLARTVT